MLLVGSGMFFYLWKSGTLNTLKFRAAAKESLSPRLIDENVARFTTRVHAFPGFRTDCCRKYNNYFDNLVNGGEMLYLVQQSPCQGCFVRRMLYFVQDFRLSDCISNV